MDREVQRDEFIRKLVSQQIPEKAPEGFTGRVMERLQPEVVKGHEHVLSPVAWGAIFLGITALVVTMIFVDFPFLNDIFSFAGVQQLFKDVFSGQFYESFIRFFRNLNINAIGIAIVIGFISLVALERIVARRRQAQGLVLL
jgi:hypothetical protein